MHATALQAAETACSHLPAESMDFIDQFLSLSKHGNSDEIRRNIISGYLRVFQHGRGVVSLDLDTVSEKHFLPSMCLSLLESKSAIVRRAAGDCLAFCVSEQVHDHAVLRRNRGIFMQYVKSLSRKYIERKDGKYVEQNDGDYLVTLVSMVAKSIRYSSD